jgi:membrane-bound lytic murein transglycosylase MltF
MLPRDPEKTLQQVQRAHRIRVGLVENPPWVIRNGTDPDGVEPALIRDFAHSLGAEPQWSWLAEHRAMEKLEHFELDVVAGGLEAKTPWSKKVALTRPYVEKIVMATPPGENAWLKRLGDFLQQRRTAIAGLSAQAGSTR